MEDKCRGIEEMRELKAQVRQGVGSGLGKGTENCWRMEQACKVRRLYCWKEPVMEEFNKAVLKIIRYSLKLSICLKRQAVHHTLISLQGEPGVGRQVCGPVPHHTQANEEMCPPTWVHSKLGLWLANPSKDNVSNGEDEGVLKTSEVSSSFTDSVGRQSHYIVHGIHIICACFVSPYWDGDKWLKSKLMSRMLFWRQVSGLRWGSGLASHCPHLQPPPSVLTLVLY